MQGLAERTIPLRSCYMLDGRTNMRLLRKHGISDAAATEMRTDR